LKPVTTADDPFAVLVDYAHTDDALDNVLRALRPIVPDGGRLCVVFGCGGDRDRTKRPRMAEVACRWSDIAYITSDNPRTEDPQAIIDDIVPGVPAARLARTPRIVDRAEAIRAAIDGARAGDVIVIAGKGHEDYQVIGAAKRHFDDREVAAAALAERRNRTEALA
jgi:UDP-N-acetylmuramoyl-L-alanyl-D-glutamate--2,6-diaminopimelate ligase